MLRVALLEASHWHAPLYLPALESPDVQVVAISDAERVGGGAIAKRFSCRLYDSYAELLRNEAIDFAFAFGRHVEMPRIGAMLVDARIPFTIEKPCGISAADVRRLRRKAETAKLYVAVPFILRMGGLLETIRALEGQVPSDFSHLSFRFIAGRPERYESCGCGWMLDTSQSGGGPLINVGVHFVDLFRLLTGKDVATVTAAMSNRTHGRAVEDYAVVTMRTADGVIGVVEAGYTFPNAPEEQREFSFSLRSSRYYLRSGLNAIEFRGVGDASQRRDSKPVEFETDAYYPVFVRQALAELKAGAEPSSGLAEAEAVMTVVDAAYRSAREGGAPVSLA